ncbi:Methyltransferase domain protein [Candidatus Bilamarchaeum dharawalense]|uniref:Methyltransferase domain protein n=1 Tax=Candidatus Bilamarchaeum dharawalense TaxID=2885759 RepID=A0A5E4LRF7_9ARCH|nr:Methyltransferase domain protein [Candidatus Bilamarchaeum dharawalense]
MDLLHLPGDIKGLDSQAQSLVTWSPVPLGSILRTHSYSYSAWGIRVTPENLEWLYQASKHAYQIEYADSTVAVETHALIAEACRRANMLDANALMNEVGARHAVDFIESSPGAVKKVIDIGAGVGGTSVAFIKEAIGRGVVLELELVLLEPSEIRLETAVAEVKRVIAGTPMESTLKITPVVGTVHELANFVPESADLIISTAAIHHESFNLHFNDILRVLKPGAPFISGDWHDDVYENPARTYWTYYVLQDTQDEKTARAVYEFVVNKSIPAVLHERAELKQFRQLFGVSVEDLYHAFDGLDPSERAASMGAVKYWFEMGRQLSSAGKKSPEWLLQCHERVVKRLEAMHNAGFVFGDEDRHKYREHLKDRGYGELTATMVGRKRLR